MIYAVNKRTKEHWVIEPGSSVSCADTDLVLQADEDGWIEWCGDSECPLPDGTLHEIKMRDGWKITNNDEPRKWVWSHEGGLGDIIAYRPVLKGNKPEQSNNIPSVGTVCERRNNSMCAWRRVEITAIGKQSYLYWDFKLGQEMKALISAGGHFRSLADTRRIKSLSKAILDSVNRDGVDFCHHESIMAERIIESIRNGHVEGIELTGDENYGE